MASPAGPFVDAQKPFGLLFAETYYAAQDPMKSALYNQRPGGPSAPMLTQAEVNALVSKCIAAGVSIDEEIDFWGWDPFTIMADRLRQGIEWVNRGLGNVIGSEVITIGEFSGPMPAGAIKSSVTLSDYPAWPVSTPVTTVPTSVGPQIVGPYYELYGPAPALQTIVGNFKLVQIPNMFVIGGGTMTVWLKLS